MSSRKQKRKKEPDAAKPGNRLNFVIGLVVGIALVAVIAYALRPKSAQPTAAPSSQPTAPVAQQQPVPAPLPVFDEADVAAAERISAIETKQLLDEGEAVILDVRDVDSYAAGHIPGALQIPLGFVQGEIPWFPQDKKLITYCT